MDTTMVGFYIGTSMGLIFTSDILNRLYDCYKKFKNSIFFVYDSSKANFGLNSIHAFRLSEKTIEAFEKDAKHFATTG